MLSSPSKFANFSDFLKFLVPALNGTVGFWATVSLNIPDFTRFARSNRDQAIGQALALPATMTLYSLIGILVTSATVVIYGTAIWDPVAAAKPLQLSCRGHHFAVCDSAGHSECEYWCQRRFSRKRFFQSVAAQD